MFLKQIVSSRYMPFSFLCKIAVNMKTALTKIHLEILEYARIHSIKRLLGWYDPSPWQGSGGSIPIGVKP